MFVFLDDERDPSFISPLDFRGTIVVRSYSAAIALLDRLLDGELEFISFDHDIASEPYTGLDVAKYIVEKDMNSGGKFLSSDFYYNVHSMNPIGAKNIDLYLYNYLSERFR